MSKINPETKNLIRLLLGDNRDLGLQVLKNYNKKECFWEIEDNVFLDIDSATVHCKDLHKQKIRNLVTGDFSISDLSSLIYKYPIINEVKINQLKRGVVSVNNGRWHTVISEEKIEPTNLNEYCKKVNNGMKVYYNGIWGLRINDKYYQLKISKNIASLVKCNTRILNLIQKNHWNLFLQCDWDDSRCNWGDLTRGNMPSSVVDYNGLVVPNSKDRELRWNETIVPDYMINSEGHVITWFSDVAKELKKNKKAV